MKYDDLETTKDLFDINDIPSPIKNIEMEGVNKETIAVPKIVLEPIIKPEVENNPKKKNKKEKEKKEKKPLTKKQKIFLGVGINVLLLIIVGVCVYYFVFKNNNNETEKEPDKPLVVIEKDNYIYKNGTLTFLNKEDKELGSYECQNKSDSLCYVAYFNEEDTFDGIKNVYETGETVERRTPIYADKYVFIYDNKEKENSLVILYNILEQKEEDTYTLVKGFNNSDYVIVKNKENKYGAFTLNESGKTDKIDYNFEYLGMINKDAKIVGKSANKYYIYNREGKAESKEIKLAIKSYNDKYLALGDNYNIYNYKGELLIDGENKYAMLLDDYVAIVFEDKLYIRDYENHKFNEEGIDVDTTEYNIKNVYDKKHKLISTTKPFDIQLEGANLNVIYTKRNLERNQVISINEGIVSKNLGNLNYFNGVLYFYKDDKEKELLGKYTCANKNNIDSATATLANCNVATEAFFSKSSSSVDHSNDVGMLPIFNERYVFIKDSIDANNVTITLYDLKNNKTLSKYAEVDAGVYAKENKLTLKTADSIHIMAKNKSNKYGVIKIDNSVSSVIPFNYSELENLGDYFVAKDSTYALIDKSGTKVTTNDYKIVGYSSKYLVVTRDNKYYVSDYDGGKIDNTAYLDIKLEDDYYAVVGTNYKLDIHKYDNPSFRLYLDISVSENNYKNDYTVSKNSNGYIVTVKSTNKTYKIDNFGSEISDTTN